MNCNHVKDNLSSFIDNELDVNESNSIKAHLIRCKECKQARDQLEDIGNGIRKLTPLTTSSDFQFRVYSKIRQKESSGKLFTLRKWQTLLLPTAAMIIGVFIGLGSNSALPLFATANPVTPDVESITTADVTAASQILSDDQIIRNYNLDSYVRRPLVPITVDTIPDGDNPNGMAEDAESNQYSANQPQYVLDNVPMRVTYERTIY